MIFLLVSFSSGLCFKDLSISPFHLVYCCVTFATMMLMSEDDIHTHGANIPNICHFLYTGRIFNDKILHPKIYKNTQKYPKNSKIYSVSRSIWKILHLTELFYTGTARGARDKYQVCSELTTIQYTSQYQGKINSFGKFGIFEDF